MRERRKRRKLLQPCALCLGSGLAAHEDLINYVVQNWPKVKVLLMDTHPLLLQGERPTVDPARLELAVAETGRLLQTLLKNLELRGDAAEQAHLESGKYILDNMQIQVASILEAITRLPGEVAGVIPSIPPPAPSPPVDLAPLTARVDEVKIDVNKSFVTLYEILKSQPDGSSGKQTPPVMLSEKLGEMRAILQRTPGWLTTTQLADMLKMGPGDLRALISETPEVLTGLEKAKIGAAVAYRWTGARNP